MSGTWRERLLGRLSRETSAGRFIPEIDGLRFVAISTVVLFHLQVFVIKKLGLEPGGDWLAAVMSKGAIGVQLFFVISGFIISLPFAQGQLGGRARPALAAYYRRRLTRLEPPYILNLLLIAALMLMVGKLTASQLWPHLLSSITYTHNLIYGEASWINGVTWSLEVECQFYLVAPLLAQVFRLRSVRTRRVLLVAAVVLSACIAEYVFSRSARWRLSLPSHLNYFLCGFLLADLFAAELTKRAATREDSTGSYAWDTVGTAAWLVLLGLLFSPKGIRFVMPIPILLAYCAAFRGRLSRQLFSNPYIYTVGGMCYTIYLYHQFILSFIGRVIVRLPGLDTLPVWLVLAIATALFTPILIAGCALLFVLGEKPFMCSDWPTRLRTRFTSLSRRPSAESADSTARAPR